jgi:hypothetical protein
VAIGLGDIGEMQRDRRDIGRLTAIGWRRDTASIVEYCGVANGGWLAAKSMAASMAA